MGAALRTPSRSGASSGGGSEGDSGGLCAPRRSPSVDDALCKPSHFLPLNVDAVKLRRLIRSGRLAPCFPGEDEPCAGCSEECLICLQHFPSVR